MTAPPTETHGAPGDTFAARLRRVRDRIAEAARRAGRAPAEVTLVAVSKTHPAAFVARAFAAGQFDFGENRVQEAEAKIDEIGGVAAAVVSGGAEMGHTTDESHKPFGGEWPRWHLIGNLQANKARRAVRLFDLIHTVDTAALVERLERLCDEEGRAQLPVLVQLSLAGEATKAGAAEDELSGIVARFREGGRVRLAGLMTMPPFAEDPERARPYFRRLRELRDRLRAEGAFGRSAGHLSMGMSHDFEAAVEEGATLVRVGTALFGERGGAR